jgi:hypothetical protein
VAGPIFLRWTDEPIVQTEWRLIVAGRALGVVTGRLARRGRAGPKELLRSNVCSRLFEVDVRPAQQRQGTDLSGNQCL